MEKLKTRGVECRNQRKKHEQGERREKSGPRAAEK